MNRLNERIDYLIKSLGMKKTAFAEKLNVSQAFISQLCSGVKQPSKRTIQDICTKFNVNEDWLRTGNGEMFIELTRDEQIENFVGDVLKSEEDSFKKKFIWMLSALDESDWEVLQKMVELMQENKKG